MKRIKRDIVSALIFSSDGKLLMGYKPIDSKGSFPGMWHIPGGGIDKGESRLSALKREVLEEVGIDITEKNIELIDDEGTGSTEKFDKNLQAQVIADMHFFIYLVKLELESKEVIVKLTKEFSKYAWFTKDEWAKVDHMPARKRLFKKLGYI